MRLIDPLDKALKADSDATMGAIFEQWSNSFLKSVVTAKIRKQFPDPHGGVKDARRENKKQKREHKESQINPDKGLYEGFQGRVSEPEQDLINIKVGVERHVFQHLDSNYVSGWAAVDYRADPRLLESAGNAGTVRPTHVGVDVCQEIEHHAKERLPHEDFSAPSGSRGIKRELGNESSP